MCPQHYSGLEDVDLSWQDDVCYSGDKLVYQGLSVDACLNRDATDQGTGMKGSMGCHP